MVDNQDSKIESYIDLYEKMFKGQSFWTASWYGVDSRKSYKIRSGY